MNWIFSIFLYLILFVACSVLAVGTVGEYAFLGVPVDPESVFGLSDGLRQEDGTLVFPHNAASFEFRIPMGDCEYVGYINLSGAVLTTKHFK